MQRVQLRDSPAWGSATCSTGRVFTSRPPVELDLGHPLRLSIGQHRYPLRACGPLLAEEELKQSGDVAGVQLGCVLGHLGRQVAVDQLDDLGRLGK